MIMRDYSDLSPLTFSSFTIFADHLSPFTFLLLTSDCLRKSSWQLCATVFFLLVSNRTIYMLNYPFTSILLIEHYSLISHFIIKHITPLWYPHPCLLSEMKDTRAISFSFGYM